MKKGANKLDQNQIRKLSDEGLSADKISAKLRIEKSCVESFCKHFKSDKSADDKKTQANK